VEDRTRESNRSRARDVRLAGKVDASCQSSRTLRASCSHLYPAQRSLHAQLLDGRFSRDPLSSVKPRLMRIHKVQGYIIMNECYVQSSAKYVLARCPQNRAQSFRCRFFFTGKSSSSSESVEVEVLELDSVADSPSGSAAAAPGTFGTRQQSWHLNI
jgi:hypothetical protein